MIKLQKHNWIGHAPVELLLILAVPFICSLVVFFIPDSLIQSESIPEFLWLFLVVFIDVGHVYSTIYRTYVNKPLINKHKNLFFGLPFLLLIISVVIHSISSIWFWRCLAYFAVYHFIRQQYGFLKIYSRKNNYSKLKQYIDVITIYGATVLPVLYWHVKPNRDFNWFLKGDFITLKNESLLPGIIVVLFWLLIGVYCVFEIKEIALNRIFNFQKNMIVFGTAISWYLGIVYFNSDLVFTFLNIICHGIPYMALVWIHGKKTQNDATSATFLKLVYGNFSLLFFLVPLIVFAYVEEGFWNAFVWKEHNSVFALFGTISSEVPKSTLNILVPLLALPQLFHYVIDGFIWKIKEDKFEWTKIL